MAATDDDAAPSLPSGANVCASSSKNAASFQSSLGASIIASKNAASHAIRFSGRSS
jgi:hypothetical protein